MKINQPWSQVSEKLLRIPRHAYHQEQAERVEELLLRERLRDVESTGSEDNTDGNPEATIRGQSSGTKSVTNRHFPVTPAISGNHCTIRQKDGEYIPHARKKLHQTTITEGGTDDEAGLLDVACTHVDTTQDESGQRESAETKGSRVGELAFGHGTVQTRLEFTTEGRETVFGGVDVGQRTIAKASGRAGDLLFLMGHLRVSTRTVGRVGGRSVGGLLLQRVIVDRRLSSRHGDGRDWFLSQGSVYNEREIRTSAGVCSSASETSGEGKNGRDGRMEEARKKKSGRQGKLQPCWEGTQTQAGANANKARGDRETRPSQRNDGQIKERRWQVGNNPGKGSQRKHTLAGAYLMGTGQRSRLTGTVTFEWGE